MKKFLINNTKTISLILEFLVLIITLWIGISANKIASRQNNITSQQNNISIAQTDILNRQTEILERQVQIQKDSLQFDKDKNRMDTAKEYREKMSQLFDKIIHSDSILVAVNEKIQNGNKVLDIKNLDRYVSEFEDIGALFCSNKINTPDLIFILKDQMKNLCDNNQIYNHYQNTKSGVSGMCKTLFPGSNMAKFANIKKCGALK